MIGQGIELFRSRLGDEHSAADVHTARKLVTLRDVARLCVDRFESVEDAPPVRRAIELLMKAGDSGSPHDVEAATDQIAHVLRVWRMMT
jgi:hypothetical protein